MSFMNRRKSGERENDSVQEATVHVASHVIHYDPACLKEYGVTRGAGVRDLPPGGSHPAALRFCEDLPDAIPSGEGSRRRVPLRWWRANGLKEGISARRLARIRRARLDPSACPLISRCWPGNGAPTWLGSAGKRRGRLRVHLRAGAEHIADPGQGGRQLHELAAIKMEAKANAFGGDRADRDRPAVGGERGNLFVVRRAPADTAAFLVHSGPV